MSLPILCFYAFIGCLEWYLALRRTLACARGERCLLVILVFVENSVGFFVLQSFVRSNDWGMALVYSAGGALGALMISGIKTGIDAPDRQSA